MSSSSLPSSQPFFHELNLVASNLIPQLPDERVLCSQLRITSGALQKFRFQRLGDHQIGCFTASGPGFVEFLGTWMVWCDYHKGKRHGLVWVLVVACIYCIYEIYIVKNIHINKFTLSLPCGRQGIGRPSWYPALMFGVFFCLGIYYFRNLCKNTPRTCLTHFLGFKVSLTGKKLLHGCNIKSGGLGARLQVRFGDWSRRKAT